MMRSLTLFTLLIMTVLIVPSLNAEAGTKNNSDAISLTVKHSDIAELFEMLSQQNNVNILLSEGVEGKVSVNLYDVSVEEAIYSIAAAAGHVVERRKNGYIISKHDDAGKTIAGGLKQIRTYKIQYSDPKKVAEILENYLSRFGRIDILEGRKMLVVEDLPDFLIQIEGLLFELDQEPAQILIEAKVLNIRLDDNQEFGLDWTQQISGDSAGLDDLATDIVANLSPAGLMFSYVDEHISVQLDALSEKGRLRTLATPKLLALEHEEAEVLIGEKTGYKTIETTASGGTLENVEFLDSGVILKVTPYIDRNGHIMMEVHPEISESFFRFDVPSQNTTEVTTKVLVEDGQTVFIGGLMRNEINNDHSGVPFLEDIPLVGHLFFSSDDFSEQIETVVMIKPQIIHNKNLSLITNDKIVIENFQNEIDEESREIDQFFEKERLSDTIKDFLNK